MAFQGTIKDMLPPMPYLTALGKYIIVVFSTLVLHGIEHAAACTLSIPSSQTRTRLHSADFFFGIVDLFEEESEDPVEWEVAWFYTELTILAIYHVVWYRTLHAGRRRSERERKRAAESPGVSLAL